MEKMTRKEAREVVFSLLFETEFQKEKSPEEIYTLAQEDRDLAENAYVKNTVKFSSTFFKRWRDS